MKSWINFITVHTLICIYNLQYTVSTYFVVLSTTGSTAFFDSNIVFSVYTLQFTQPYLFCCVINNRVHSFFLFQYSLHLSCGLMWYHISLHFYYYVIIFLYIIISCMTFQFVPIFNFLYLNQIVCFILVWYIFITLYLIIINLTKSKYPNKNYYNKKYEFRIIFFLLVKIYWIVW